LITVGVWRGIIFLTRVSGRPFAHSLAKRMSFGSRINFQVHEQEEAYKVLRVDRLPERELVQLKRP
jgi:hypothetical protein